MSKKHITSKIIKLIVICLICFAFIFINPKGFFNPLRGFFLRISIPFQRMFYIANEKGGEMIFFLSSISQLKNENMQLVRENNSLAAQVAKLEQEKKENDMLREQLNLLPRDKFDLIGCFVVGQDPQGLSSWVLIDKGDDAGIKTGMAVIVSGGILIGKVDEVFSHSAKVNFLINANSSINALDLETGAKGIVRGEYGLGLMLDMVKQTDLLNEGDSIVTSGLGSEMPKGLLIGKIKKVDVSKDKLFQEAVINSRIKYSGLDAIFVIKSVKE